MKNAGLGMQKEMKIEEFLDSHMPLLSCISNYYLYNKTTLIVPIKKIKPTTVSFTSYPI